MRTTHTQSTQWQTYIHIAHLCHFRERCHVKCFRILQLLKGRKQLCGVYDWVGRHSHIVIIIIAPLLLCSQCLSSPFDFTRSPLFNPRLHTTHTHTLSLSLSLSLQSSSFSSHTPTLSPWDARPSTPRLHESFKNVATNSDESGDCYILYVCRSF